MSDSLADKVIDRLAQESTVAEPRIPYPNQWGIDDTGFPWPNPVNAEAVAARLFFKHGKKNGLDNIFRIGDDVFIDRKKINQNKPTLLSLYDKPKIVLWANEDTSRQDPEAIWKQVKSVISSEWPIVWATVRKMAPEYDRNYIRIADNLVWGKDEADILFM